jgi:3-oxoacyl-[acyl-carrier protein] reductase
MLLEGKTAFITGTNRGIGKEILKLFALNGANVYACSREENEEQLIFLNELSKKFSVTIIPLYFDLNDESAIEDVVKKLFLDKVKIDILVNNAGVAHGGFFRLTKIDEIRNVFQTNFFSQLFLTQCLARIMVKYKSGVIINITSIAGIDALPGYIAYGSSKAALNYATKTLSKELSQFNIRINSIAPGLTNTDMAVLMEEKAKAKMIMSNAFERLANPEEIANCALFLASDSSSFINGQIIRVDGGVQ